MAVGYGHPSYSAFSDTAVLARSGIEVTLLTFCGLAYGRPDARVTHTSVIPSSDLAKRLVGRLVGARILGILVVNMIGILTSAKAVSMNRGGRFDLIVFRDASGFHMMLPQLLGIVLPRSNWIGTLTGIEIHSGLVRIIDLATRRRCLYRLSFKRSNFVFTTEFEYVREYYDSKYLDGILRGKVRVVPFALPPPSAEGAAQAVQWGPARGEASGLPRFLSFGEAHEGKDLETVFRVFSDYDKAELIHAGAVKPKMFAALQPFINSPNVRIVRGYITEAQKESFFAQSVAVVLSYRKDLGGVPSILWQCARSGTPVIASDHERLASYVRRHGLGLVFETGNPSSLRKALDNMLALGEDQVETMRRNLRDFYDEFSKLNYLGGIESCYDALRLQETSRLESHSSAGSSAFEGVKYRAETWEYMK